MVKRGSKDHDFATIARTVVEKAIGEHLDGTPLETRKPQSKRAVGGKMGGQARAKSLSSEQRRQIAMKAARARWKTQKGD